MIAKRNAETFKAYRAKYGEAVERAISRARSWGGMRPLRFRTVRRPTLTLLRRGRTAWGVNSAETSPGQDCRPGVSDEVADERRGAGLRGSLSSADDQ